MKLLHFSFPYRAYVDQLYSRHEMLAEASFVKQDEALKNDFFPGASPGWLPALSHRGYEVRDYAFTVDSAQKAWAREHGVPISSNAWQLEVARAQIMNFRPDILAMDPFSLPRGWLSELRGDCKSIRVVMARHSSPRPTVQPFSECDLVLSADRAQVDHLRSLRINAVLHHHGFDERVLPYLPARACIHRVVFSGQLRRYEGFHLYRARVLMALIQGAIPVDLYLLAEDDARRNRSMNVAKKLLWDGANLLERMGVRPDFIARLPVLGRVRRGPGRPPPRLDRAIRRRIRRPVFGIEMYAVLRQARIAINVHGDVSAGDATNLRLWEATGVGTCLLTDHKDNMSELFEVGKEVVTYNSPADCVSKTQWLLEHPNECEAIARAGQARTLRDHTYTKRSEELDAILQDLRR